MPVSNLSAPIMEALQRRAQGQDVGRLTEVNPPTAPGPATATTPPPSVAGARTPQAAPQAGGMGGAGGIGGIGKEANDSRIIEALITYLRKKVL